MKKVLLVLSLFFAFTLQAFAVVDINKANEKELEAIKGIGPKKAQAIVEYRKKNGPFKSVEDFEKVKGIGAGIVKQIAAEITIDGQPVKVDGAKPAKITDAKSTKTAKTTDAKASKESKTTDSKTIDKK